MAENVRNVPWDIRLREDPGTHGVVNIVVDIGDAVGRADDLPLQRLGDKVPCVAENAHAHLIGQIQPRAAALELVHHAQ